MTADAPPPIPSRSFPAAARATWIFAAAFLVHAATACLTAPHEKIEKVGVATIAAMLCMNLAIAGGLVWLGFQLRAGRGAAVACAVIGGLGFMGAAAIVGLIATKSGYQGTAALVVVQVLFGAAWLAAIVLTARAFTSR